MLARAAAPDADRPLRLTVLGAAPGTGNLGVTALGRGLLTSVVERAPDARVTFFDYGRGERIEHAMVRDRAVDYTCCGAVATRRWHRPESLARIRLAARRERSDHPAIRALRGADAVLDVTGGDSFTDLYGRRRFRSGTALKRLALAQGRRLVLLPQTIGPFRHPGVRRDATRILERAAMVWSRDRRSHRVVERMLGRGFDPARHCQGVDLAFAMEAHAPCDLPPRVARWIDEAGDPERPLVGFNVSGLLFNDDDTARSRFGLRADYRDAVVDFLRDLLRTTDARVLLVPHVVTHPAHPEHDVDAVRAVAAAMGPLGRDRVAVAPTGQTAETTKWIIARTDWFCGTRMHATIAALSSGVPTAAIAYSAKTRGVFATCGLERGVTDPRRRSTTGVVDDLRRAYASRDDARRRLRFALPAVERTLDAQMDAILAAAGFTALRATANRAA